MKRRLFLSFGLLCLGASPLLAIDPILVPVGPERHPYQGSPCCHHVVAADMAADGSVFTLWESNVAGVNSSRVLRFDDQGLPLGDPIEVPLEDVIRRQFGRLSAGPDGTFVLLSSVPDGPVIHTLRVTRYSSTGPVGDPIDLGNSVGSWASVDHDALGRFVVLWNEIADLRAALFDPEGNQLGPIIEVSQSITVFEMVTVAFDPSGGFWTFYEKRLIPELDGFMHFRRYDADGDPLGPEVQASAWSGMDSRAAIAPNGTAATVTHRSHSSLGQLYAADGELGPAFVVWNEPLDMAYVPLVAPLGNAEFITSAMVEPDPISRGSGYLVRIDALGQSAGPHLILSHPTRNMAVSELVSQGSRTVVFVYQQGQSDYFQIYEGPLFADGFESGDLSAWAP